MVKYLSYDDKIGILDPDGTNINPLNSLEYSDNYKHLAKMWSSLPAYKKADEILEKIRDNQLIFIISGTGSGKSVIIPKLALHYTNYEGIVAMTLPKRTITLSAATFSAATLDVELGKEIGYVYKNSDKKMINSSNKIIYMTDGTLVSKFTTDPTLSEYSVILIDEAHERSTRIDLIMLFLKNLLQSGKRPDLRVIIMSATIDSNKYKKYFNGVNSAIINISGQPNHEIRTIFLQEPTKAYSATGLSVIDDLVGLTEHRGGDILFFITTSEEALRLCKTIRPKYPNVYCIEVYADMDSKLKTFAESSEKFLELGNYNKKVVMATNVAESSLTIDGLKYVIDSGYELFSYFDPNYYGQILEKRFITQAQALQRRGRVGRTSPGVCYHLLTETQFNSLEKYPEPNILKEDITMDLLKIIRTSNSNTLSEGLTIMNQLMDPPKKTYVDVAIDLYKMYNIINSSDVITKIGIDITQFSSFPINHTLFLIYAYQLHCAKEASIIVAMLDVLDGKLSNLFFKSDTICLSKPTKQSGQELIGKIAQKKGDHFTFLKIYQDFKDADDQQTWAKKYGFRLDLLNKIDKDIKMYYYKILNLSKAPQLSRVSDIDVKKRLLEALRRSHQHLTARKMIPIFPKKRITGQIIKDSVVYYHYNKRELEKKNFIYDKLININGSWEFSAVTFI